MTRPWYLSQTKWGGILLGLVGFFKTLCTESVICFVPEIVLGLMTAIGTVLLINGGRNALAKNGQGK